MNVEFLQELGINEDDPNVVLSKLGTKEIELLDKRNLAETNGADERVQEIDLLLEKLKVEREVVKEEAKLYIPKKEEASSEQEQKKELDEKKNAAFEKLKQKKKNEEQTADATNSSVQQNTQSGSQGNPGKGAAVSAQTQNSSTVSQQNVPAKATSIQTQNNQTAQLNNATATLTSANGSAEYSKGLKYYQMKDYDNAFKCFRNIAEAKSVKDQTQAQERTQASYLLAVMYREGVGATKDIDRSNHYLKRAADFGFNQAQLEYGCLLLSQNMSKKPEEMKARKVGWKYIENAADSGLLDARKKYIDLAENSSDADKHIITKAKSYVPLIKAQLDSYEAKKCDEWIGKLNDSAKAAKKKASYPIKYVVGELLFLIGTIYLFKGLNPIFFEEGFLQIGRFVPDIPDILIIKWDKLLVMTEPYMTHQGIFGGWLIILGNTLRGLGVKKVVPDYGNSNCKTFGQLVKVLVITICFVHFIANVYETKHILGNGGYMQFLAMIGCILLGRLLGLIMFKIVK